MARKLPKHSVQMPLLSGTVQELSDLSLQYEYQTDTKTQLFCGEIDIHLRWWPPQKFQPIQH